MATSSSTPAGAQAPPHGAVGMSRPYGLRLPPAPREWPIDEPQQVRRVREAFETAFGLLDELAYDVADEHDAALVGILDELMAARTRLQAAPDRFVGEILNRHVPTRYGTPRLIDWLRSRYQVSAHDAYGMYARATARHDDFAPPATCEPQEDDVRSDDLFGATDAEDSDGATSPQPQSALDEGPESAHPEPESDQESGRDAAPESAPGHNAAGDDEPLTAAGCDPEARRDAADDADSGRARGVPPPRPGLASAAARDAGHLADAHYDVILATLGAMPPTADATMRVAVEEQLIEWAKILDPRQLADRAIEMVDALDPDYQRNRERRAEAQRSLWLGPTGMDGLAPIHGKLTRKTAALLRAFWHSAASPDTDAKLGRRETNQRNHDAFALLLRDVLDRAQPRRKRERRAREGATEVASTTPVPGRDSRHDQNEPHRRGTDAPHPPGRPGSDGRCDRDTDRSPHATPQTRASSGGDGRYNQDADRADDVAPHAPEARGDVQSDGYAERSPEATPQPHRSSRGDGRHDQDADGSYGAAPHTPRSPGRDGRDDRDVDRSDDAAPERPGSGDRSHLDADCHAATAPVASGGAGRSDQDTDRPEHAGPYAPEAPRGGGRSVQDADDRNDEGCGSAARTSEPTPANAAVRARRDDESDGMVDESAEQSDGEQSGDVDVFGSLLEGLDDPDDLDGGSLVGFQRGLPAQLLIIAPIDQLIRGKGLVPLAHGGHLRVEDFLSELHTMCSHVLTVNARGDPLRLGRARRIAPTMQRLALLWRDRGRVVPGCKAAAAHTQVHHIDAWRDGGATDVDRLALVCTAHHRVINSWDLINHDGRIWCVRKNDPDATPAVNETTRPADGPPPRWWPTRNTG